LRAEKTPTTRTPTATPAALPERKLPAETEPTPRLAAEPNLTPLTLHPDQAPSDENLNATQS
jgi:hypothetical protein